MRLRKIAFGATVSILGMGQMSLPADAGHRMLQQHYASASPGQMITCTTFTDGSGNPTATHCRRTNYLGTVKTGECAGNQRGGMQCRNYNPPMR